MVQMDLLEKSPSQPPKKTDTHKYEMSSETYRWIFTNKRRIQLFENIQCVSSRTPSHLDTLSALSSVNPTWGAKSCGELFSSSHMAPGCPAGAMSNSSGSLAPLQSNHSRQAGSLRVMHNSNTILLAHQYFGAWFAIKAVLFQINTSEKCWVASTSSLSSF